MLSNVISNYINMRAINGKKSLIVSSLFYGYYQVFCMYGCYSLSKLRETYIHLNYHCMRHFLSYYCRHLILLILIDRHILSEGGKSYPEGNLASAIFTSKEKE